MVQGIIGKKLGTTRVIHQDGAVSAVSAIQAGPCTVTQVKTPEKDGYSAAQLAYGQTHRRNKPERGHLKPVGTLFRHLREFPLDDGDKAQVGQRITVDLFQPGDRVDIIGTSKGRGFAGVVKRHGFGGGPKTHGQSDRHRAPGSIGAGTYPGRVIKGLRMAGHIGNARVTVRNVEVVQADPERNLLLVRGSVPGARNGLVIVRRTKNQG